jgi:hypothetical protein
MTQFRQIEGCSLGRGGLTEQNHIEFKHIKYSFQSCPEVPYLAYYPILSLWRKSDMDPKPMTVAGCADHVPGLGIGSIDIRGR